MPVMFATWQVGQLLWSMIWFALFFMWIWMVIQVFADIFRSRDLGGWAKALWTLFVVFMPWLGVLVYLLARGGSMAERRMGAEYRDMALAGYGPAPAYDFSPDASAPGASAAGDLSALADLRARGVIDESEFQAMKERVMAS
jgi:Phospholipase_D-nuclease N-terminal/Short C-terminal domain